jgi:hypothetical protein
MAKAIDLVGSFQLVLWYILFLVHSSLCYVYDLKSSYLHIGTYPAVTANDRSLDTTLVTHLWTFP